MRTALMRATLSGGAVVLAFGLGTAVGQHHPPSENKGVSVLKATAIDLGPEIEGMH
jgi:hypothetical protein